MTSSIRHFGRIFSKLKTCTSENLVRTIPQRLTNLRSVHVTCTLSKDIRLNSKKINVAKEKVDAHKVEILSEPISVSYGIFPDCNTNKLVFDGILYSELPIVNIKTTKNNTIFNLTNHSGKTLLIHSAGIEGFKNAKKGTGPAAQQAAISFATRARRLGMPTVRVRVQGFALGRMNSIMGLNMGGLKIVSVTDTTRVSPNPPRPRNPKSL